MSGERPDLQFGPFRLSFYPKRLSRDGSDVALTPKALDTLVALSSRPGELIEKQELMKLIWGDVFVDESTLTQNIFTIRKALGDGAYIETVPRRGYRFIAPVRQIRDSDEPDHEPGPRIPAARSGRLSFSRNRCIAVTAGAVMVAAFAAWLLSRQTGQSPIHSLVVLPFANLTGDSSKEYFSDGLTEEIINATAGIRGLRVVARTSAFQFKGIGRDIRKIGEDLHADAVLEGSVRWDENRFRITAQLNTTKDGYHIWSRTWDREFKDIFVVQQEIARAVAVSLVDYNGPLPRNRQPTNNLAAYHLYLEGRFFREKVFGGSLEKAVERLERAIALDPNFAGAYAMLADCYLDFGYTSQMLPKAAYPKAAEAVRKAIELDDTYSYSHSVLGLIHLYFDWDWQAAEPELRRAIALDPEDPNAYHYYSHFLVSAGRFAESLEMSVRALDLDPVNARVLGHNTWNQAWARKLSDATTVGQKVVDLHPEAGACCGAYLIMAYEQATEYENAIRAREAFGMSKDDAAKLRGALKEGGFRGYWKMLVDRTLAQPGRIGPYFLARDYAQMKETNRAFHWLEQAIIDRDSWIVYLNADPAFDGLRGDARFEALIRTVGIPNR